MSNQFLDLPVSFACGDNNLQGIISKPQSDFTTAVIIVVGGPQFRVGSHRQFVLLARYLADHGILVLRFDYTGMGYSDGRPKMFYQVDSDIDAALDYMKDQYPHIEKTFLWGLCDAASAICFTAHSYPHLNGIIISNPWVRSEASHSEAILKNYYRDRLFSLDVWFEILRSPSKIYKAVISLFTVCSSVLMNLLAPKSSKNNTLQKITIAERENNLAQSVLSGMRKFSGKICLLLSQNDLTADEFRRVCDANDFLNELNDHKRLVVHEISDADHTFSSAEWRRKVEIITMDFICT